MSHRSILLSKGEQYTSSVHALRWDGQSTAHRMAAHYTNACSEHH